MDQSTISAIIAIASLVGAAGGLFAAFAAFRSAGIAKQASDHAAAIERNAQLRELVGTANEVVAETIRVDDLSNKTKMELQTLFTFSGASGNSRLDVLKADIESKQRSIGPVQEKARSIVESRSEHKSWSEEKINDLQSELDNYVIQVTRIKEELLQELASYEDQNRIHREKTIKGK